MVQGIGEHGGGNEFGLFWFVVVGEWLERERESE